MAVLSLATLATVTVYLQWHKLHIIINTDIIVSAAEISVHYPPPKYINYQFLSYGLTSNQCCIIVIYKMVTGAASVTKGCIMY